MARRIESDSLEHEEFELEVPEEFQLAPVYTVPMPGEWEVHIYEDERYSDRYPRQADEPMVKGWRLVMYTSRGQRSYDYGERFLYNKLDVKLMLDEWVRALSKKRRRKTVHEDPTHDDDD